MTEYDQIENPEHYCASEIECIDAIKASMTREEYLGFLKGQIIKYTWRYRSKGDPRTNLGKGFWFYKKLQEEFQG
tara:strand:+ start:5088 stop:5312 length:225 start_codon:yes stop_codon:yes gene_type:complete